MRPTKAFRENTNAKDTPGTCMCHIARPSQDMSFPDKFWSFHQNEQVRVVTRSFYLLRLGGGESSFKVRRNPLTQHQHFSKNKHSCVKKTLNITHTFQKG
jgi:hypothetical protein